MTTITQHSTWTAFRDEHRLATGTPAEVAVMAHRTLTTDPKARVLIFDDHSGRTVDFDPRGTEAEIAARLQPNDATPDAAPRRAGRPKLGVKAKEVTLLPRHWEWLAEQQGSASATLRKLIDAARKEDDSDATARQAQAAADGFMMAILGDEPGYEQAARALYAGDRAGFMAQTEHWPADLRDHARRLAAPALP